MLGKLFRDHQTKNLGVRLFCSKINMERNNLDSASFGHGNTECSKFQRCPDGFKCCSVGEKNFQDYYGRGLCVRENTCSCPSYVPTGYTPIYPMQGESGYPSRMALPTMPNDLQFNQECEKNGCACGEGHKCACGEGHKCTCGGKRKSLFSQENGCGCGGGSVLIPPSTVFEGSEENFAQWIMKRPYA